MTRSLPVLSVSVLATCRAHWKRGRNGRGVADDCCKSCPLMGPCCAGSPTTHEGLAAWREALNKAAEALARAGGAA